MLHTKIRVNRPADSGKEDFRRVLTIYGCGGHLGHVIRIMSSDFHFLLPEGYTTLNIHEIWLRLFRGDHLLFIRAKMTSFVNSHD